MNTHIFDGKYDGNIFEKELLETHNCDINLLVEALKSEPAKYFAKILLRDNRCPANFEPYSKLYADDLLRVCCKFLDNPDFIAELEIQLVDMQTGLCPQGRVTRLYQLVYAFLGK